MTFHKQQQGFTLIELLVVVAIIGILSSIVLAALGSARQRARQTAAQATLSQVRAQAELDGDFDTVCNGSRSAELIAEAEAEVNETAQCLDETNNDSGYAVSIPLGDTTFCVDSNGTATSGLTAQNVGGNNVCQ